MSIGCLWRWARGLSWSARNAARLAWRWTLPLDVLAIVPQRISTTASSARPCSSRTAAPDGVQDRGQVVAAVALDLVHEDEALRAVLVDRERGAETRCEQRVACARGGFDVLRVMVETADDDEVVDSAGDVELAFVDEAKVAGAQKRAVAGVASACVERRCGFLRVAPVALADGFAGDPDLANAVRREQARGSLRRR